MSFRSVLRSSRADDSGMGLIEVITAFMVFAVVAVGMSFAMVSMTRITADNDNREIATNLAAAEIDRLQAITDAFTVYSNNTPGTVVTVNGVDFTVATTVAWQNADGSSGSCGSGGATGGNLQYKRVNVRVTWDNMFLQDPVRADSALAPATRINDPSYGTILVSVYGADGTGRSAITVTATPTSGGAAITSTISPTDADGCTYILKVVPGSYRISVSKANYIDSYQIVAPYADRTIAAGSSATAQFQFDQQASFTLKYAANAPATPATLLPTGLQTTYFSGASQFASTSTTSPVKLHPFLNGYSAVAGKVAGCADSDPNLWTETPQLMSGVRTAPVPAAPGGSATLLIPMGIATFQAPAAGTIVAEQQTGSYKGSPGCASPTTYNFAPTVAKNATTQIALPYGSWKLYTKSTLGILTQVTSINVVGGVVGILDPITGTLLPGLGSGGSTSGNILTLDPRVEK